MVIVDVFDWLMSELGELAKLYTINILVIKLFDYLTERKKPGKL